MVLANPIYIRCTYGISGRKITKYTVIYGVYRRDSGQPYAIKAMASMKAGFMKHRLSRLASPHFCVSPRALAHSAFCVLLAI